jgi:hypothetical protein
MDSVGVREVLVGALSHYIVKSNKMLGVKITEALMYYPAINKSVVLKFDHIKIAEQYLKILHREST